MKILHRINELNHIEQLEFSDSDYSLIGCLVSYTEKKGDIHYGRIFDAPHKNLATEEVFPYYKIWPIKDIKKCSYNFVIANRNHFTLCT